MPRVRISKTAYFTFRKSPHFCVCLTNRTYKASDDSTSGADAAVTCNSESESNSAVTTPPQFNQFEGNDLIIDFNLSKICSKFSHPE